MQQEELATKLKNNIYPHINYLNMEDAKLKNITVYINTDLKQIIGKEEYRFVILDVSVHKVFDENGSSVDLVYHVTLWADDESIQIELCHQEYCNEKWLKQLNIPATSFITRKDYLKLIKSIPARENEQFYFDTIGIHKLDGKYYYAASNCTITADGIKRNIRARQDGFDLNFDIDEKKLESVKTKTLRTFIKYTQWNFDVFIPIHCIPILAILWYFLKTTSLQSGAVLWIDGNMGSGKTQLAVTMGDYFNRGDSQNLLSHLNTPKAKYNDICSKLTQYKNAVFILDDIKKEETSRNRDNSKNITDLVVRSIYMGKVDSSIDNKEAVDTAAIITGEFFKEQMSTVSRILYLHIDNFLNNEENSKHFREIQEDCYYFSNFMFFFLQWILKKMEDEKEIKHLHLTLDHLKQDKYLVEKFSGKESGSRIIETIALFQLVPEILDLFFKDCDISNDTRRDFLTDSKKSLYQLGYATYLRIFNYGSLVFDALKKILPSLKIKDCRYGNAYLEQAKDIELNPDYWSYNLSKDESIFDDVSTQDIRKSEISSEDILKNFGKIYLFGMQKEYDGILYKRNEQESLLIRENTACNLIREELLKQSERLHFKLYESDCNNANILSRLSETHAIYGYKRKDGFNRLIKFPLFTINENSYDYSYNRYMETQEMTHMFKVNTEAIKISSLSTEPCIPLKEFREQYKIYKKDTNYGYSHFTKLAKKLVESLNTMDRYIDSK